MRGQNRRYPLRRWQHAVSVGLLCCVLSGVLQAALIDPLSARFRRVDFRQGLSQDSVLAMAQDETGALWFGTQDGLNRFDGFEVRVYRPQGGDSQSLASPWAGALAFDDQGRLWVAGTAGLSRYDPQRDRFHRYTLRGERAEHDEADAVFALHRDRAGRLWAGNDGGLWLWRAASGDFAGYLPRNEDGSAGRLRVRAIRDDGRGGLWIATVDGLQHFDPMAARFSQPGSSVQVDESLTALCLDRLGRLWIGSERHGLWRLDDPWSTGPPRNWRQSTDGGLSHDQVRSLLEDSDGLLWVGTEAGVDRIEAPEDGELRFAHYRHSRYDVGSLGQGAVASLLQDHNGSLWFGTWEGGASQLSEFHNRMFSLRADLPFTRALRDPSIRSIAPAEGGAWLGSEDGIYRYRSDPAELSLLPGSEGLFVFELRPEPAARKLWVGSNAGLRVVDLERGELQLPEAAVEVAQARVRRVYRDDNRTWVAVIPDGLYVLGSDLRQVETFHPIAGLVSFIRPLDGDTMLVGSQDGLYWFSRDGSTLRYRHALGRTGSERQLPSAASAFLRARQDGRLWLGTSGSGLVAMHLDPSGEPDRTRFEVFDRRRGLASDLVGWLQDDEQGRIWLSTTVGLSRFDPASGRFRNFDHVDGTLGRSYWIGAGARLSSGMLAFGGFEGATVFNPAAIKAQPAPATPRLQSLGLVRSGRNAGSGSLALTSALSAPLVLSSSDVHALNLRFSSTELLAPEHIRFEYRMDGYDEDWNEVGADQRLATYTNLAPGDYRFRVRARNLDGLYSPGEAVLPFSIDPLWWQTWWARGFALGLVLAALALAIRSRLHRQERQRERLERQVKERTADIAKLGDIAKELTATLDIEQAMDRVYRQVNARLDAHVFAIGLLHADENCVREAYVREASMREEGLEFSLAERDRPAVWCVRERRELITERQEDLLRYVSVNLPPKQGGDTESIVYLPLIVEDRVIGFLTVQSLMTSAYDANQLEFLRVLASYTAIALDNATSYARLDQAVAARTADILALGEIGRELTATLDAEEAMSRVHRHVSAVLDAYVFSIGQFDPELRVIRREYAVEGGVRLPRIEYALDEVDRPAVWCVREGRELITRCVEDLHHYVSTVLTPKAGVLTQSIVYLPLLSEGRVRGFLSVQSKRPDAYSKAQLEFLRVLASHTAIALENARSYARLDQAVAERTVELRQALDELRTTQHTLIEREKMASLGGLVAGVAHEVNTPIGIAVTAASHLQAECKRLFASLDAGKLTRSALQAFRETCDEGLRLVLGSLDRAHHLIGSFKRVAVDQSSEQRRRFELRTALEEILFSLRPSYRRGGHDVDLDCPPGIEVDTFPGALFQIITNLVTNSVTHGFADGRSGHIQIDVHLDQDKVQLHYHDDGLGMDGSIASRAFEPFFTTRRGSGGSGLGLHLVYNLATQLLGGSIQLSSQPGQGCAFILVFPRTSPVAQADPAQAARRAPA